MKQFHLLIFLIIVSSCIREDELIIDTSPYEKKLIVYSVISPNTDSIFVTLALTGGNNQKSAGVDNALQEALVSVSNGEKECNLKLIKSVPVVYACSQDELQVENGKEYSLKVVTEGSETAISKTQVPDVFCKWVNTRVPSYGKTQISEDMADNSYHAYHFESEWLPSADSLVKNFFAVRRGGIKYQLLETPEETSGYRGFGYQMTDSVLFLDNASEIKGNVNPGDSGKMIFSTYIKEDYVYEWTVNSGFEWMSFTHNEPTGIVFRNLTFYLITLDKNYSDYRELCSQYDYSGDLLSFIFSSFSGILPSYSNIQGGYGLFGSYGIDSVSFNFNNKVNFNEERSNSFSMD